MPVYPGTRLPLAPGDLVELRRDKCDARHREDGCLCGRTLRIRSLVAAVTEAGVPAAWRCVFQDGRSVSARAVARKVSE